MGYFEFKEHMADEKFVVKADDLNDAFATSVSAFYTILLGDQELDSFAHTREIKIEGMRLRSLLYDFLNELIFYYDAEDLLLPQIHHLVISKGGGGKYCLEAILAGDHHYNYSLETEIKNMTYSEMDITESENGVEMTVVVDI